MLPVFYLYQLRGLSLAGPQKWLESEKVLVATLLEAKAAVRAALCDDFDTPVSAAAACRLIGGGDCLVWRVTIT